MQKRGLIVLVVATAFSVAAAVAAVATGDRYAASAPVDRPAFPALAAELGRVASVGLERRGLALTFRRRGERWLVAQKADYPADAGKVRKIVLALADMRLVEPKTRLAALYPRLEVEDPGQGEATLVTLADGSGRVLARLIVGKRRIDRLGEGQSGVYVRRPADARSWLASGDLDLSGDLASWLDRKIVDIPDDRIAKLRLVRPDGSELAMSRAKPDDRFAIVEAPPATKYQGQAATSDPATTLAGLDLDDVAPAAAMPVPVSGVASAAYTTFDGLRVELRLVDRGKTAWAAVAASGVGKAAADAKRIEARVSGWSYAIPSYKAALIRTKFADLLAPKGS